jgi:hypothetical protein
MTVEENGLTSIRHIMCREDLIGKVGACFKRQLFGEHQRIVAVKEEGCDLVWSALLVG